MRKLVVALSVAGDIPPPQLELALIPGRRFRADLSWPDRGVYCEVDGGAWVLGRHGRGSGIDSDCEKTSLAAGLGWRLVRVSGSAIRSGEAVAWIRAALAWQETRS